MRVDHLTYPEPSIPAAVTNDFRATKSPALGIFRPLKTPIPLDFVVMVGARVVNEM